MMTKVFPMGLQIDPKDLECIREQCVQQVKKTSGAISFKDTVEQELVR